MPNHASFAYNPALQNIYTICIVCVTRRKLQQYMFTLNLNSSTRLTELLSRTRKFPIKILMSYITFPDNQITSVY